MDGLDDSENNAKISDSAYSISCSNSQSRRSHSSKSTHSGSHSSGSSGYGGNPSNLSIGNKTENVPEASNDARNDTIIESHEHEIQTDTVSQVEEKPDVEDTSSVTQYPEQIEMDDPKCSAEEINENTNKNTCMLGQQLQPAQTQLALVSSFSVLREGFTCVVSMQDGVVLYTTSSITTTLGYPEDMWIGRFFIDFVHPKDRNSFSSQVMSGIALASNLSVYSRIRMYRGLSSGFGMKNKVVCFMPFTLSLSFKEFAHENGSGIYLVMRATPFTSAYKSPNESVTMSNSFIMRHGTNGKIEYTDPISVPYLGYLPQELQDQDMLSLYHPEDLPYLQSIYRILVKERNVPRSKTYRILAQNGEYIKIETEFSCIVNPWTRKLKYVCGRHFVVQGPEQPDVFKTPENNKPHPKQSELEKMKIHSIRENIARMLDEVKIKFTDARNIRDRADLTLFMGSLVEEQTKPNELLSIETQDPDYSYIERDSVMLGGISPHHENESKSSTETQLSYNQLNYSENLQRYFNSYLSCSHNEEIVIRDEFLLDHITSPSCSSKAQSSIRARRNSVECSEACTSHSDTSLIQKLSEELLAKHNSGMQKEFIKKHRKLRPGPKSNDKVHKENRQKRKDHIARCNAPYKPTPVEARVSNESRVPSLKRPMRPGDSEATNHKVPCSWMLSRPGALGSDRTSLHISHINIPSILPVQSYLLCPTPMFTAPQVCQYSSARHSWDYSGSIRDRSAHSPIPGRSNDETRKECASKRASSSWPEGATDCESSYSSLCSSFFKTETGSTGESDAKNKQLNKLCTSELVYKYQISTKSIDEVLALDKQKIEFLKQPKLVNEQLSQLYLELQLEGVQAGLFLEEGITSSDSSGEDNVRNIIRKTYQKKIVKRRCEYSKLVMIYEEDAPLPSPSEDEEPGQNIKSMSPVPSCSNEMAELCIPPNPVINIQ